MIPKIIHYCWFGGKKFPPLAEKCISSWQKYLPEYKMMLWNEENFDINSVKYVKEAYESKKYAFVTDYVRLYALEKFGGIYMDTDVEVLKSFNNLLHLTGFSGFESLKYVPTGIMASVQNGEWVRDQITYYDNSSFKNADGTFDTTTNTQIISGRMIKEGFILNNSYQVFKDMHFFPNDYFSPKMWGRIKITQNTYCIHHFAGSWNPPRRKFKRWFFENIVGGYLTEKLVLLKRRMLKVLNIMKK